MDTKCPSCGEEMVLGYIRSRDGVVWAKDPSGIDESRDIATHAGRIAGNARRELEEAIGRSVISSSSASDKKLLDE